ncbi:8252_t:CDS:1 [Acaulospora morrowiae]|uniref:8252_t:CDS:1 n=1 Tax=Acaulospora morrowiae TaxID=94023 RepID=A0A9N9G2W8_9GLOM|nr:8252_t:CDS:1 [Acaulospora morrowiae]
MAIFNAEPLSNQSWQCHPMQYPYKRSLSAFESSVLTNPISITPSSSIKVIWKTSTTGLNSGFFNLDFVISSSTSALSTSAPLYTIYNTRYGSNSSGNVTKVPNKTFQKFITTTSHSASITSSDNVSASTIGLILNSTSKITIPSSSKTTVLSDVPSPPSKTVVPSKTILTSSKTVSPSLVTSQTHTATYKTISHFSVLSSAQKISNTKSTPTKSISTIQTHTPIIISHISIQFNQICTLRLMDILLGWFNPLFFFLLSWIVILDLDEYCIGSFYGLYDRARNMRRGYMMV